MADTRSRSRSPRRSTDPESRRERSRSPRRDGNDSDSRGASRRSRSRSPRRDAKSKSDFSKAFKWKSKDGGSRAGGGAADRDEREYRQRDMDSYRPRRYGGKDDRERNSDRNRERERREGADTSKVSEKFGGTSVKEKFGTGIGGGGDAAAPKDGAGKAKPASKPAVAKTKTPMTYILVTVNDRLGTKATIPCLPSDTVGDFKKLVAAHIGRQPHEIMLKRQGERPFKDFITLGDYGVSSGVQLDLELDTGD
ncbi:uncharacterized protein PV09_00842 [Verruconis gallopava]|uniref:Ubiquitin-like modifier HUB1 n=1 Tax=Verruconis gallopava TaxID=253628 RepID=A0A0D2AQZ0_9PEZI|nr:uncharacterized protein PV09_00842 [Verruconis gallopava]KIW08925.1 hypothetical protein PV09_00842 [Verruconis gallopava]